jgi:hypothetical protein
MNEPSLRAHVLREALAQHTDYDYYTVLNRVAPVPQFTPEQRRQLKVAHDIATVVEECNVTEAQARDAYDATKQLLDHAYDCGVAFWQKKVDETGAQKMLEEQCPGFPAEIYAAAIKRGTWEAMW